MAPCPFENLGRTLYYIVLVGDWTHDLAHTVASNMVKESHASHKHRKDTINTIDEL